MTDGRPRLRIAALVPSPLQVRLLAAVEQLPGMMVCILTGRHDVALLPDIVSLVVVDPMSGGPALVATIRQLLHRGSPWPLLAYTAITHASADIVLTLGRQGLRDVVFTPYEDPPARFARTLWRVATAPRDGQT
ncbi:MAG TPA: hypothetical protein VNU46_04085 [Gemmatimonadaceae bacterium]|jgi:hypothetical protein|nr:hypothetical protein [Gemmatimonadaceae bacterium]